MLTGELHTFWDDRPQETTDLPPELPTLRRNLDKGAAFLASRLKVHQKRLLDKGKIEKLVLALRSIKSTSTDVLEKIRIEADYFAHNAVFAHLESRNSKPRGKPCATMIGRK